MSNYDFPIRLFLARLKVDEILPANIAFLEKLHRQFVYNIPFENFDVLLHKNISLIPRDVDLKLLFNKRGGYCHELNGCFIRAVKELGYNAKPLLARVHLHSEPTAKTHLLGLVMIDNTNWLIDVGFGGGGLRAPIPLFHGVIAEQDGYKFKLKEYDKGFMLQTLKDKTWVDLYSFDLSTIHPSDIDAANHFTATHPSSIFVHSPMAVKVTPYGEIRLSGNKCTTVAHFNTTEEEMPHGSQYFSVLEQKFDIQLKCTYKHLSTIR